MGKKSKRQRGTAKGTANRREAIQARRQPKDARTKANDLREEFARLSKEKFGQKAIALEQYGKLMSEEMQQDAYNSVNFATKEDYSFLMGIYRNTQAAPLFRAKAVAFWGEICSYNLEERDACLSMQLAVKICKQSLESGPSICEFEERCLTCLHKWREGLDMDGVRKSTHAGDQCDWCGKIVQEYGVDFLACCGRCKLSYYCSVECQKKDWKEGGHKEKCRKKREFLIGDMARFADPCGPIPFEYFVHILAPIHSNDTGNGKPDKWLVSDSERDNLCVVLAQNLRGTRSARWLSFEDHWNKKRALKAMVELVAADGYGCSSTG